jgi:hypothetical protein
VPRTVTLLSTYRPGFVFTCPIDAPVAQADATAARAAAARRRDARTMGNLHRETALIATVSQVVAAQS